MILRAPAILVLVAVALAGCGQQNATPAPPASLSSTVPFSAEDPSPDARGGFGVGTDTRSYLADTSFDDSFAFCQTPGYQDQNCPGHMPGLTRTHFKFEKHVSSDVSVTDIGTSTLGKFVYDQIALATGDFVAANATTFHWTDTLHVNSERLAAGTRVSIDVSLALSKYFSGVDCYRFGPSYGSLEFHGTGTDPNGNHLLIGGNCAWPSGGYYGNFYYYNGGNYLQTPTDTGTIETAVGRSFKIGMIGSLSTSACEDSKSCDQTGAGLGGTVTWKITHITPGASYSTDSGARY